MNAIATPTTDAPLSLTASLRWTILGAPLLILFGAYLLTASRLTATPQANVSATADDWRRTATGWERVHCWSTTSSWSLFGASHRITNTRSNSRHAATRPSRLATQPSHLDIHPATFALAQLLASVFVLTHFRNLQKNPLRLSSLLSTVTHSFRSSAFGS